MQRAVDLGNSGDPNVSGELVELTESPSAQVRRLAVSALGKLADVLRDRPSDKWKPQAGKIVQKLTARLSDRHPQVRQYAVKALRKYGTLASYALPDLRDIMDNPDEKEYNRHGASVAIDAIEDAVRLAREQAVDRCRRCGRPVSPEEYDRSRRAFQRIFCDACFDEVYLERRNFDAKVELKKTVHAKGGTLVQSEGERRIAQFLHGHNIDFRYDERFRIIEGYAVRPDFYLPEFDIYIEYWGMDTTDYKIGMLKKLKLYQQQGKRLISLYRKDFSHLESLLEEKLAHYIRL